MKNNRILLPDGTFQERQYENALIMEHGYQERYEELLMNDTREGMVLAFIISKMDDENELVCSLDTIAQALHYSKASVALLRPLPFHVKLRWRYLRSTRYLSRKSWEHKPFHH